MVERIQQIIHIAAFGGNSIGIAIIIGVSGTEEYELPPGHCENIASILYCLSHNGIMNW